VVVVVVVVEVEVVVVEEVMVVVGDRYGSGKCSCFRDGPGFSDFPE
jgi:hypothetical protein